MQQNVGEAVFGPDDDDRRTLPRSREGREKTLEKGHMV
jgi:hypothetical protein